MDLLDRYLAAVGALLPGAQRDDITAELRDVLLNRYEEQQASLGRPLNRDEEAALLRGFGHPVRVAARYGPQHYLVGPELYPIYAFSVKVLLAIIAGSALVAAVVNAILKAGDPGPAIVLGLAVWWNGSIVSIGILTIIAAILQRSRVPLKALEQWNPRDLPAIPPRPRRQNWFDHVAGIVAQSVAIWWWTRVISLGQPMVPLGASENLGLAPAAIWTTLYWPVVALAATSIAVHVLKLMGPSRRTAALGLDLVAQIGLLVVAAWALRAGHWVDIAATRMSPLAVHQVDFGVNLGIKITLIVLVVVAACMGAYDLWALARSARGAKAC